MLKVQIESFACCSSAAVKHSIREIFVGKGGPVLEEIRTRTSLAAVAVAVTRKFVVQELVRFVHGPVPGPKAAISY